MNNMQFGNPMGLQTPTMQNPYMTSVNPYANRYTQPFTAQQNNGINWVQGIEGAKAWQLAPNSNVVLLDSDTEGRFYIKVSDNVGMCNLRIFDYVEVTNNNSNTAPESASTIDMSNYVTRDELQEILNSLNKGGISNGKQSVSANERTAKSTTKSTKPNNVE